LLHLEEVTATRLSPWLAPLAGSHYYKTASMVCST